MTGNCSEYPRIKLEFGRVRERLLAIREKVEADMLKMLTAGEIKQMKEKKKVAEKWARRYEAEVKVGDIVRGS
jgi:hypothetical protein